jgi:putative SOS response-associated peptidase YedK
MCGRYLLTSPPEAMRRVFGYSETPNFPPRYNIAPTQPIAVVTYENNGPHFALMRWGLIPSWVKDPKGFTVLINARAETAAEKPAFRAAIRRRRAIIPADGWYEWQVRGSAPKQPYLMRPVEPGPVAFAALWETWLGADGTEIDTAAMLTTDANRALSGVHNRMPVILQREAFASWLDPRLEPKEIQHLLRPAPDEAFEAVAVSTRVNSVQHDDESLIRLLAQDQAVPPQDAPIPSRARQLDLF